MDDARFAEVAGFTPAEADAWEAVRAAACAVMQLARDDSVHPMESAEMATAFHHVQARLLARPSMRALRDDGVTVSFPDGVKEFVDHGI